MHQYLQAVREVLEKGARKENRTGVDTLSTFNVNYEIDLAFGFPLLTTKEVSWKNIVVENLWFLSGDPHIEILHRHGCKFWDPWADETGKVPSAYGHFWRHFPVQLGPGPLDNTNDQLTWMLNELRRNPMSRRLVVSAWAPSNAQTSALPPCHALWVLNVQNTPTIECAGRLGPNGQNLHAGTVLTTEQRLCLHLTQRSCDIALGVPYNIAGYAFILSVFSHLSGIAPGIFAHTLIDAHAYTCKPDGSMADYDHVPGLREQLGRTPRELPRLTISPTIRELSDIEAVIRDASTTEVLELFKLEGYDPHPPIKFKVAV